MISREEIADTLAAALLGGVWTPRGLHARAKKLLGGGSPEALRRLVADALDLSEAAYPPSPSRLADRLLSSVAFDRATALTRRRNRPPAAILAPPQFNPAPAFAGLDIPRLATPNDLAAWLETSLSQLDWLADAKRQHASATSAQLRHYFCSFVPKRSGGVRLIESPNRD